MQLRLFTFGNSAVFNLSVRLTFSVTYTVFNLILDTVQEDFKTKTYVFGFLYLFLITFEVYTNYVPLSFFLPMAMRARILLFFRHWYESRS